MKEKEFNVKFKTVSENEMTVYEKNRKEALDKAKELFNSELKNTDIHSITKYYYVLEINNKDMLIVVRH